MSPGDNDEPASSDDWENDADLSEEMLSERLGEDEREIPVNVGNVADATFEDVSIDGDGGVKKYVVRCGESGKTLMMGWDADLKFVLRDESGAVIDVSQNDLWPNKEFRFVVGSKQVMEGLNVAAMSMERKEIARFLIRADYGFGDEGCPPKVPGGTNLILDAQLMGYRKPRRGKLYLYPNQVMPYVLERKTAGNVFYLAKDYRNAVHEYKVCVKSIANVSEEPYRSDLQMILLQMLNNLSAAHLGLGNGRRAIKYASMVLQAEPKNEKALYRRSKAQRLFSEFLEDAQKDLAELIRLNPKSKQFRDEYALLKEEIREKQTLLSGDSIFKGGLYETNPRVFMEFSQGRKLLGRIEIKLFSDRVPKTCANFQALISGETKGLAYEKTQIHRVIQGYLIQGGDVTQQSGAGGKSIYGDVFKDENFLVKSNRPGVICMANSGPDTNQSQFFITLSACEDFEGKFVAFGKVVLGLNVLNRIAKCNVDDQDRPEEEIKVFKCGIVKESKNPMIDDDSEEN